jgi:energy-converting hydrogenase A subunit M
MQRLAQFLNIDVKDVIDIIEVDLKDDIIVVEGEENFNAVESIVKQVPND